MQAKVTSFQESLHPQIKKLSGRDGGVSLSGEGAEILLTLLGSATGTLIESKFQLEMQSQILNAQTQLIAAQTKAINKLIEELQSVTDYANGPCIRVISTR